MKIGIDIDNTITQTLPLLKEYCKKYNDEIVKRNLNMNEKGYVTSNLYAWTEEEQEGFFLEYIDKIRMEVKLKPYAREVINRLKQEHEIYIITARDKKTCEDPYEQSKEYLEKHEIFYDELVAECKDKLTYCLENKIDVMIDDDPKNIQAISQKIPVILLRDVQNEECEGENKIKVDTWKEIYEVIKKLEVKK